MARVVRARGGGRKFRGLRQIPPSCDEAWNADIPQLILFYPHPHLFSEPCSGVI